MKDDPEAIKADLAVLIGEARASGKWLWCHYQNLWFSPDDLATQNANSKFLWGPVNWRLRDPAEHVAELAREAANAQDTLNRFKTRIGV